ncbi:DMSO/TMAO reductase YedYZ molybdopterin-dependent catalytic subunit [Saccharothrix saharensis]|uniref:DMSO/TMAO reductase YedYZ molybdopterin-dependent catalytic subunit n=1 Tax=Saccharothrix saharensis TaxID=571190 RepID=A0A543JHN9_9PSEU|nr:molybdopterin-dependent oxidoreductase [Saccharothrix saharensis]TQM82349.1 DMSO/TMAO reductase YedYZ molybdopterin-dependent catalytic subunit [Saccharothrix saharensis]
MNRVTAALVGVLGVAAALAAGHLVAGLVGPSASPFLAVGNTAIDLAPRPLKDFAVRAFGTHDKLVLLLGMAAVLLGAAVAAGLLSRRSPLPGTVLAVVLGLLGAAAVLYRPDLGQLGILAPVAALVAGVAVFRWLHAKAAGAADPAGPADSRRAFLVASGATGLAALVGQFAGTRVDVEASRRAVGELKPASPAPPLPPNADFAAQGTPTFITPNADFYRIDTALSVPRVRAEDWVLRVHGMVDRELVLRYDDLRRRDLVERTVTLVCVSNEVGGPHISTANFVGVPLRDVLLEAGVRDGADQLFSTSADRWTAGSPLDVVLEPDRGALIALGMNGEPLPLEHGFPARLVVPGLYGYVSATKWVVDLEVTTFDARRGYWLDRGWAREAPVKVMSRIDRPERGSTVPGRVVATGVAWAQPTGVDKVEVRVDNGPWRTATLADDVSGSTWRMWRAEFDLPPGGHTIEARATDRAGATQPQARVAPVPDGATGWHSVFFTVA